MDLDGFGADEKPTLKIQVSRSYNFERCHSFEVMILLFSTTEPFKWLQK